MKEYKSSFEQLVSEEMMILVIKKYGFEAKETIDFCKMIEDLVNAEKSVITNKEVEKQYYKLMR